MRNITLIARSLRVGSIFAAAVLAPGLSLAQAESLDESGPQTESTGNDPTNLATTNSESSDADTKATSMEQDGEAGTNGATSSADETENQPQTPEPRSTASGESEAGNASTKDSGKTEIGVERLPDSAYPTYKTRGLYGGSLWLTFHGLQWPNLPKRPGEPDLLLGLSGSGWVDTAYEAISPGNPTEQKIKYWRQQGRFVFRATPTYRVDPWFVQGQAELVANNDQTLGRDQAADTDDLWVRAGRWDVFDIQVGRFQGWEVYHLGMGLDLNTFERKGAAADTSKPPDFYGVTYAWDRPSGAGNIAGHVYVTDWLRVEDLIRIGNDNGYNTLGDRGALIFDIGWLKLKGGAEYLNTTNRLQGPRDRMRRWGYGGSIQFVLEPYVEFGINGARALSDSWDNSGAYRQDQSYTIFSTGGFLNARIIDQLLVGGGINYTHNEDLHVDSTGNPGRWTQTQIFGAVQYGLFGKLFLKLVVGNARAYFAPSFTNAQPFTNTMSSVRLRASFYF